MCYNVDVLHGFEFKIYSTLFQEAFNDIRSGNNPGCGTEGFTAASGWDPLTVCIEGARKYHQNFY